MDLFTFDIILICTLSLVLVIIMICSRHFLVKRYFKIRSHQFHISQPNPLFNDYEPEELVFKIFVQNILILPVLKIVVLKHDAHAYVDIHLLVFTCYINLRVPIGNTRPNF